MNCILCKTEVEEDGKILSCTYCGIRFYRDYVTDLCDYEKYDELYEGMEGFCEVIKNNPNPMLKVIRRGHPYRYGLRGLMNENYPTSVLDVGCGWGYITWALHSLQFDVTGIDISKKAISFAKKLYGLKFYVEDIHKYLKRGIKHDVIIAIETIEHVTDPKEFLRDCLKIAPRVVITTPNSDYFKKQWISEEPPVHTCSFTKESLEWLAKNLDIKLDLMEEENFIAIYERR